MGRDDKCDPLCGAGFGANAPRPGDDAAFCIGAVGKPRKIAEINLPLGPSSRNERGALLRIADDQPASGHSGNL